MNRIKVIFIAAAFLLTSPAFSQKGSVAVKDVLEPLPGGNAKMEGYFGDDILLVQENWAKGVMPYDEVIEFFRSQLTAFHADRSRRDTSESHTHTVRHGKIFVFLDGMPDRVPEI